MIEKYMGWKNAQTQVVYVSIVNNQTIDADIRKIMARVKAIDTDKDGHTLALATELQSYFEDRNPLGKHLDWSEPADAMPYRDLMTLAFHAIDWDEVAAELLKD